MTDHKHDSPRLWKLAGIGVGILLVFWLVIGVAKAQEAVPMNTGLTWTAPTQYVTGEPILAGELLSYSLECGTASGSYDRFVQTGALVQAATKDQLVAVMGLVINQDYYCAVSATTTNGLTSAFSGEVFFVIPDTRRPNPPVLSLE